MRISTFKTGMLKSEPLPPISPRKPRSAEGHKSVTLEAPSPNKARSAEPAPPQTPGIRPVGRWMKFDFRPVIRSSPRIQVRGKQMGKKVEIMEVADVGENEEPRPPTVRPRSRSAGSRRSRADRLLALQLENSFLRSQLEAKKNALDEASAKVGTAIDDALNEVMEEEVEEVPTDPAELAAERAAQRKQDEALEEARRASEESIRGGGTVDEALEAGRNAAEQCEGWYEKAAEHRDRVLEDGGSVQAAVEAETAALAALRQDDSHPSGSRIAQAAADVARAAIVRGHSRAVAQAAGDASKRARRKHMPDGGPAAAAAAARAGRAAAEALEAHLTLREALHIAEAVAEAVAEGHVNDDPLSEKEVAAITACGVQSSLHAQLAASVGHPKPSCLSLSLEELIDRGKTIASVAEKASITSRTAAQMVADHDGARVTSEAVAYAELCARKLAHTGCSLEVAVLGAAAFVDAVVQTQPAPPAPPARPGEAWGATAAAPDEVSSSGGGEGETVRGGGSPSGPTASAPDAATATTTPQNITTASSSAAPIMDAPRPPLSPSTAAPPSPRVMATTLSRPPSGPTAAPAAPPPEASAADAVPSSDTPSAVAAAAVPPAAPSSAAAAGILVGSRPNTNASRPKTGVSFASFEAVEEDGAHDGAEGGGIPQAETLAEFGPTPTPSRPTSVPPAPPAPPRAPRRLDTAAMEAGMSAIVDFLKGRKVTAREQQSHKAVLPGRAPSPGMAANAGGARPGGGGIEAAREEMRLLGTYKLQAMQAAVAAFAAVEEGVARAVKVAQALDCTNIGFEAARQAAVRHAALAGKVGSLAVIDAAVHAAAAASKAPLTAAETDVLMGRARVAADVAAAVIATGLWRPREADGTIEARMSGALEAGARAAEVMMEEALPFAGMAAGVAVAEEHQHPKATDASMRAAGHAAAKAAKAAHAQAEAQAAMGQSEAQAASSADGARDGGGGSSDASAAQRVTLSIRQGSKGNMELPLDLDLAQHQPPRQPPPRQPPQPSGRDGDGESLDGPSTAVQIIAMAAAAAATAVRDGYSEAEAAQAAGAVQRLCTLDPDGERRSEAIRAETARQAALEMRRNCELFEIIAKAAATHGSTVPVPSPAAIEDAMGVSMTKCRGPLPPCLSCIGATVSEAAAAAAVAALAMLEGQPVAAAATAAVVAAKATADEASPAVATQAGSKAAIEVTGALSRPAFSRAPSSTSSDSANAVAAAASSSSSTSSKPVPPLAPPDKERLTRAVHAGIVRGQAKVDELEGNLSLPAWKLDTWLASINFNSMISEALLARMRDKLPGGCVNPKQELAFVAQIGKAETPVVVEALLGEAQVMEVIGGAIHSAARTLQQEIAAEKEAKAARAEAMKAKKKRQREAHRRAQQRLREEEEKREAEEARRAQQAAQVRSAMRVAEAAAQAEEEARTGMAEASDAEARASDAATAAKSAEEAAARAVEEAASRAEAMQAEATKKAQSGGADAEEATRAAAQALKEAEAARAEAAKAAAEAAKAAEAARAAAEAKAAAEEIEREAEAARAEAAANAEAKAREKAEEDAKAAGVVWTEETEEQRKEALEKLVQEELEQAEAADCGRALTPDEHVFVLSAEDMNAQFSTSGAITLFYSNDNELFYQGLERVVGKCGGEAGIMERSLMEAMADEHCDAADSDTIFEATNHAIKTTSRIEWAFVTDANGGLVELALEQWPPHRWAWEREARSLAEFASTWQEINEKLTALGEQPLSDVEFVALRLYTGPMFVKYNGVMRGTVSDVPFLVSQKERLCLGNYYPTTVHSISAAVVKLGKLEQSTTLYRAPGGALPKSFWRAPRGGIEPAFMSTSTDREAAMGYARRSPSKILFEIEQGLVARGASVQWLSQCARQAQHYLRSYAPALLRSCAPTPLPTSTSAD